MDTKRIEYIDALRGFSMYLVVYAHIWTFCYHADNSQSFASILVNFFLVLFFFVSGFVAYKKDMDWSIRSIGLLLRKKAIQLLIPSVVFTILFYGIVYHNFVGIKHIALAEYWFTVQLFVFFAFYYLSMLLFRNLGRVKLNVVILIIALAIYMVSFSHVVIEKTQIGTDLFQYLGMKNWRYYLFFCLGIVIRNSLESFKNLTDNPIYMAICIIGFFFMVFFADQIDIPLWKPLNMIIYGTLSIIVFFTFFRKYEDSFKADKKPGYALQYIGKRTLDIYMIHYFLLPNNLNVLGNWFSMNPNPAVEFFVTTTIACMVMALAMVIGNIIRLSPFLSYYLLGGKKRDILLSNP